MIVPVLTVAPPATSIVLRNAREPIGGMDVGMLPGGTSESFVLDVLDFSVKNSKQISLLEMCAPAQPVVHLLALERDSSMSEIVLHYHSSSESFGDVVVLGVPEEVEPCRLRSCRLRNNMNDCSPESLEGTKARFSNVCIGKAGKSERPDMTMVMQEGQAEET
ncbi:hypothetical protein JOM56_002141 [Amanita muscaria]